MLCEREFTGKHISDIGISSKELQMTLETGMIRIKRTGHTQVANKSACNNIVYHN